MTLNIRLNTQSCLSKYATATATYRFFRSILQQSACQLPCG